MKAKKQITKCPSHGSLAVGNLKPIDCQICSDIVRNDPELKRQQKEYGALVKAKNKGKLPRALFVRGMLLEDKLNKQK